jgi:transcriptional regulator with XRE-family HTH domain
VQTEIGAFLQTRRARIAPGDVGLPDGFSRRRVPGLRREEVALLAGVSPDYYVRLEQGRTAHVSDQVLDAVARALGLTDVEAEHLRNLAHRHEAAPAARRSHPTASIDGPLYRLLDVVGDTPAMLIDASMHIVAANAAAEAVFAVSQMQQPANSARQLFFSPDARVRYSDWEAAAEEIVAHLRLMTGRFPHDARLVSLIGELAIHSRAFQGLWAKGDVREKVNGLVHVNHPVVGDLEFDYQVLTIPARPDRALLTYLPRPDSGTSDALRVLLSWMAEDSPADGPQGRRAQSPSA